jgi:hypothetical protein
MELKAGYTKEVLSAFMQTAFREKQWVRRTPHGGWKTLPPVPEQPQTIPEQPQTVPEQPQTVPEQPQTVPEQSPPVAEQPQTILEQSPPVAETPEAVAPQPSPPQGLWQRLRNRFRKPDNPKS